MLYEENVNNEQGNNVNDNTDYIAAIKELKENSVDRQKYEQVVADRKRLLESIVNGQKTQTQNAHSNKESVSDLRKKLFNKECNLSNLEYVENALKLRDALMENGEEDPFIPQGKKTICTEEDRAAAQRVADVFQQCVDYAQGDSEVFTNELMRRTKDVSISVKRKR